MYSGYNLLMLSFFGKYKSLLEEREREMRYMYNILIYFERKIFIINFTKKWVYTCN